MLVSHGQRGAARSAECSLTDWREATKHDAVRIVLRKSFDLRVFLVVEECQIRRGHVGEGLKWTAGYFPACHARVSYSDHCPLAAPVASSLADLEHLELVRRGEEEDRISTLPDDQQAAARNIEGQLRAEWDRTFALLQTSGQAGSQQQLSSVPQPPSQPARSISRFWRWLSQPS